MKKIPLILLWGFCAAFAQTNMQIIKKGGQFETVPILDQTRITFDASSLIVNNGTVVSIDDVQKIVFQGLTGLINKTGPFPESAHISPDPANKRVSIDFRLKKAGLVNISVFNSLGENIKTLVYDKKSPGKHSASWDLTGQAGQLAPNGIYVIRIDIEGSQLSGKTVIVK